MDKEGMQKFQDSPVKRPDGTTRLTYHAKENNAMENKLSKFYVADASEDFDSIIVEGEGGKGGYFAECFERSGILEDIKEEFPEVGESDNAFNYLLNETDATFYTYADYDADDNLELVIVMQSDELNCYDKIVPLNDDEKKELDGLPQMQELHKKLNEQAKEDMEF